MYSLDKIISLDTQSPTNSTDWFFWTSMLIIVIFSLITFLVFWKKSKVASILTSLVLGMVGLVILLILNTNNNISSGTIETTRFWLSIPGTIFIWGISIVIPIYIFAIIVNFIISGNTKKIGKRTFATSFWSLVGIEFFGMLVALFMLPIIIYIIPDSLFGLEVDVGQESGVSPIISYFTKWWLILIMFLVGILTGIILNILQKRNLDNNSVRDFFKKFLECVNNYFKIVVIVVPLVILTRLFSLGLFEIGVAGDVFKFILSFLGVFWFGGLLIFGVLFWSNIILSSSKITKHEKATTLTNQIMTIFASQNPQASLFDTQTNVRRLGVSEEISQLTPTQGTMMGMVMCNGFSPMLIMIFIIANKNGGSVPIIDLSIVIGLMLLIAICIPGHGSADLWIILSSISSLGYPTKFGENIYLSLIMPAHEINERTISKPNNTLGHVFATLLTEKVHKNQ